MHKGIHYTIEPHKDSCFDFMIGISGWVIGCIEGGIVGILMMCGEKKDEGDLINEIEIFVTEMESGYSTGKKDTKILGKVIHR